MYTYEVLEGREVEIVIDKYEEVTPPYLSGNPDNWHEAEGGELLFTIYEDGKDVTFEFSDEILQKVEDDLFARIDKGEFDQDDY